MSLLVSAELRIVDINDRFEVGVPFTIRWEGAEGSIQVSLFYDRYNVLYLESSMRGSVFTFTPDTNLEVGRYYTFRLDDEGSNEDFQERSDYFLYGSTSTAITSSTTTTITTMSSATTTTSSATTTSSYVTQTNTASVQHNGDGGNRRKGLIIGLAFSSLALLFVVGFVVYKRGKLVRRVQERFEKAELSGDSRQIPKVKAQEMDTAQEIYEMSGASRV
jgi:hypothetical protein